MPIATCVKSKEEKYEGMICVDNEKILEFMTKMYGEMKDGFNKVDKRLDGIDVRLDGVDKRFDGIDKRLDGIDVRLDGVDKRFDGIDKRFDSFEKSVKDEFGKVNKRFEKVEKELSDINKAVIRIENDHGNKIDALFDGYKQNSDKLDRIEKEVSKHDDFILKRIK